MAETSTLDSVRKTRAVIPLFVTLGLVVASCSSTPDVVADASSSSAVVAGETSDSESAHSADSTDPSGAAPATEVEPADADATGVVVGPVFETVDGSTFDLGSIDGTDTLLWFWAPWCPACHAEAAEIVKAHSEYGDEVNFIGVAARDDLEPMQEFVAQHELAFVQIADFDQTIWTQWGVVTQPAFVFLDDTNAPTGHLGAITPDQLRAQLDALG